MTIGTYIRAAMFAALLVARGAAAQSTASEHIAAGDRDHAANNLAGALRHYELAIAADSNSYEAHWKASRDAVDAGEIAPGAEQKRLFRLGEQHARRAVATNGNHAEGHVALARALGRTALTVSAKDRVKYAAEVRTQASEALKYDPRHPAALHIMGMWNAEVMRLNGISRFMAKNFLGGQVFGSASWKDAVRYMEEAVRVDPDRLVHRMDLADVYADAGDKAKARTTYQYILSAPASGPAEMKYKERAERALKSL